MNEASRSLKDRSMDTDKNIDLTQISQVRTDLESKTSGHAHSKEMLLLHKREAPRYPKFFLYLEFVTKPGNKYIAWR